MSYQKHWSIKTKKILSKKHDNLFTGYKLTTDFIEPDVENIIKTEIYYNFIMLISDNRSNRKSLN